MIFWYVHLSFQIWSAKVYIFLLRDLFYNSRILCGILIKLLPLVRTPVFILADRYEKLVSVCKMHICDRLSEFIAGASATFWCHFWILTCRSGYRISSSPIPHPKLLLSTPRLKSLHQASTLHGKPPLSVQR